MFIAAPTLLLTLLSPLRVNLTIFALTISYLFYEWFSLHPLRVDLMGGGYNKLFVRITHKKYFHSSRTNSRV